MFLNQKPILRGPRVILRSPLCEDAIWRQRLGYVPEIVRMFGGVIESADMTLDAAERWIDRLMADPFAWIIEVGAQGVGEIRLHRIDLDDQTASLAVGILDPEHLGHGIGREAISLVAHHAFHDLKLHRLAVRVLAFNERAIRCYQACGFVVEGRERQSCRIGEERHDDIIMGLLGAEFLSSVARVQPRTGAGGDLQASTVSTR